MPNTNDNMNLNQGKHCVKTTYSRETVITLLSSLCQTEYVNAFNITSPALLISANNHNTDISNRFSFFCANPTDCKVFNDPVALQQWQSQLNSTHHELTSIIPFHSGWLGYFAYSETAEFNYYPWTICFDHQELTLNLLGTPSNTAYEIFESLLDEAQWTDAKGADASRLFSTTGFSPRWRKQDYASAFDKIQHYLRAGDCYQINLTQPYKAKYKGQASALLTSLLSQMQPNFGGYFKALQTELISLSPERFIAIDNKGRLEAKPIKGTIKRDTEGRADQLLINELTHSSKNRAENLMIVDLLRNDLSMSAIPGSVKVDKLFELESHPNVHHLVSTISAQLKPGTSPATAIAQAFPGGSITGAPKIRAMEIIAELEVEPRSLYCGSLGYFSDSGHCDFNILIRNLEFRDGTITCWGGGGITIDSEVNDEYEESITKIQRIMDVVESTGKSSN